MDKEAYLEEWLDEFVQREARFEKRFASQAERMLRLLEEEVEDLILSMDASGGLIENNSRNVSLVGSRRSLFEQYANMITSYGASEIDKDGNSVSELAQKRFKGQESERKSYDYGTVQFGALIGNGAIMFETANGSMASELSSALIAMVTRQSNKRDMIKNIGGLFRSEKVAADGRPHRIGFIYKLKSTFRAAITNIHTATVLEMGKLYYGGKEKMTVFNHNPMDHRSCAVCVQATIDSPMDYDRMASRYGFPSRHPNCRCYVSVDGK